MKSLIALIVIFSVISISYAAHHLNEGLAYTPLNEPGLDVQGANQGRGSHESLFYCDIGAAREDFTSDDDYYHSCAEIKRSVHPFLPVTVASTGEGKPIVFFGANEEIEVQDGSVHPMQYVICDDATCSSFSEVQTLEGFNGKHQISWDHMWVSGQKILVVAGTGRFISNPTPKPNLYALQYGFCTNEGCDSFVTKDFFGSDIPAVQATILTPKVVSISVYGPKYHQKVAFYYTANNHYEILTNSNFLDGQKIAEFGIPSTVPFTGTGPLDLDENAPFGDQYEKNQAGLYIPNLLDVDYTALVRCNNPPNCFVEDLEIDYLYSGGSDIAVQYPQRTPFNTNFEADVSKRSHIDLGPLHQTVINYGWGYGIPRWTVVTMPNPSLLVGTSQGLWVGLINYKNQKFSQGNIWNPNSRTSEVFWEYGYAGYENSWYTDDAKRNDFPYEQPNTGEFEEAIFNGETPSDTGSYLTFIPCGLDGTGCRKASHLQPYQFDEFHGVNPNNDEEAWSPFIEQVAYPIPDPHLGWSFAASRHNWHESLDNSVYDAVNKLNYLPTDGYNQVFSPFAAGAAGNGFPASIGVVSDASNEPTAAGWSVVLSVCLSENCDQQVYRYLMDSSALNDNWGTLDDPFSAANEIINHPDGSWTIVLFVQPNSKLNNGHDWVREAFDESDLPYFPTTEFDTSTSTTSTIPSSSSSSSTQPTTSTTTNPTSSTAPWSSTSSTTSTLPTQPVDKRDIEQRNHVDIDPTEIGETYPDVESAQDFLQSSNGEHGSTGKPLFIHCLDDTCSEASISSSVPDLVGSKVPVDMGAYRDILQLSGFTLDPVHDPRLVRVHSNRPHSYAFVGEDHEYLLVSIRDIDQHSEIGHTVDGSSETGNLYPSLRFYATTRYSSPNGQPCSHENVGTHAVSDSRTYVCTRLFIGNDHHVAGISGWVKYYEWVDVGASLATRIFPDIPSGSYNIFTGDSDSDNQLPNHFLYPENIASANAFLNRPNDPFNEKTSDDFPTCEGNCGNALSVDGELWCSCGCDCDDFGLPCCPSIAQFCPSEVSSAGINCEFYGP